MNKKIFTIIGIVVILVVILVVVLIVYKNNGTKIYEKDIEYICLSYDIGEATVETFEYEIYMNGNIYTEYGGKTSLLHEMLPNEEEEVVKYINQLLNKKSYKNSWSYDDGSYKFIIGIRSKNGNHKCIYCNQEIIDELWDILKIEKEDRKFF